MKINKKFIVSIVLLSTLTVPAFALNANASLKQGIEAYKESNYIGCLQKMAEVLSEDPSNTLAHYYVGMSNIQLGNGSKGKESYEKVVKLNTNEHLTKLAKKGISGIIIEEYYNKEAEGQEKTLITDAENAGKDKVKLLEDEKKNQEKLKKLEDEIKEIESGLVSIESGTPKLKTPKTETEKKIEEAEARLKALKDEMAKEAKKDPEVAIPKTATERQVEYLYQKGTDRFATPRNQGIIREIDLDNLKNDFNEDADKNMESTSNDTDKKKMNW